MLSGKVAQGQQLQSNQSQFKSWLTLDLVGKVIKIAAIGLILTYLAKLYLVHQAEQNETDRLISTPKINDIYFLDFRLMSNQLRPTERYRIAKIFDITGNVVTLRYGDLLFTNKRAAKDSVRFGQLRYSEYFQPERINLSLEKLQQLRAKGAIYLVKRPRLNKLFGNEVSPTDYSQPVEHFILGRQEYLSGQAHLANYLSETYLEDAFELFQKSADLGYPAGQVALAQMYLMDSAEKDLQKAMYWLEKAALQSNKPAILKYEIVCKQVENCYVADFYQMLIDNGVNLKVREMAFKLRPATLEN